MSILKYLVGLPASGKSTYCEKMAEAGYVIVSSDAIREEVFGDVNDQKHNAEVFEIVHNRIHKALKNGENVVMDATNLSSKKRIAFLNTLAHFKDVYKEAIVFAVPVGVCVARNAKRDRKAPETVLYQMEKRFQMPDEGEGFDDIKIINKHADNGYLYRQMEAARKISQDNHHHRLTIGGHCDAAAEYVHIMLSRGEINDEQYVMLHEAAKYHDIGKVRAKVWHDMNGNPTDEAHYYAHENISAYTYLCRSCNMAGRKLQKVVWLINNHMKPYKAMQKLEKRYDKELVFMLNKLHEADLAAH